MVRNPEGLILCLGLAFALSAQAAQNAGAPAAPGARGVAVQAEAAGERRSALVIGNGAYGEAALKNPVNDARAIARALQQCGFSVTRLENANRSQMRAALRDFGARIQEGGVGLFYFAGHGMAVAGHNYLIPTGADIHAEDEVATESLDIDAVLSKMETAHNRLNILILDACRNNPFGRSLRGPAPGLVQMDAPKGTYIAFATAPGRTAADGDGDNGLYTRHLLANLEQPGLRLEDVFKRVRAGVLSDSHDQQMPWDSSSMTGDFFFRPGSRASGATAPDPAAAPARTSPEPWKQLVKDGFETEEEFARRIAALPRLPLGTALPQREQYDLAKQLLPLVPSLEPWAAGILPKGTLWVKLDRETAKRLCDEGAALVLEGRFAAHGGKAQCLDLEALGSGRYALGTVAAIRLNKGPLIGVTVYDKVIWLSNRGTVFAVERDRIAMPVSRKYGERYEDIYAQAAFKPLAEQVRIAREHGISLLLVAKCGVPSDEIYYLDVATGKQLMSVKQSSAGDNWDRSGLLDAAQRCEALVAEKPPLLPDGPE